jgi:hypothetical protein
MFGHTARVQILTKIPDPLHFCQIQVKSLVANLITPTTPPTNKTEEKLFLKLSRSNQRVNKLAL